MNVRTRALFVLFIITVVFAGGVVVFAQDSQDVQQRRAELEAQLDDLEQEIERQRKIVEDKRQERQSLERDVAILDAQIRKSELSIRARNLEINRLSGEIGDKQHTIESLTEELAREKQSLAQLIRKRNEMDAYSLVEVMLSNQNLSEFFADLDSFSEIEEGLHRSFEQIRNTKANTEVQKASLEEKRQQEQELRQIQVLEKQQVEEKKAEKQEILAATRGEERVYQQILDHKQKTAAEIRAELFTLRGSAAIPFGEALDYAQIASEETGVRPALILGIIAQESRMGEFIGTGNWKEDMHPTRDQPVFEQITAELGLDPDQMPVSAKPWYGWGGAMGPAQFIPSTWVLYKDQVARLTGNNPPNPWNPEDAFMASAILLRDNGAAAGTYGAERLAALRYFAGWANADNPSYAFYGDGVMDLAEKYQQQINVLNQS